MIKSLKDLLDKFSRFTNSLVYDGGICKRLYKKIFLNSLNFGIYNYEEEFSSTDFGKPFLKLYSKYNMLNIAKLCNFRLN